MTQQPALKEPRKIRKWNWRDKVQATESGCLEWQMHRNETGYGIVGVWQGDKSVRVRAHRWVYEQEIGAIPEGKVLMHLCDNPACCNPQHLRPGSRSENTLDAVAKGRNRNPQGARHPRAKLTDEQVFAIRASSECSPVLAERYGVSPRTIRQCKQGRNWKHLP